MIWGRSPADIEAKRQATLPEANVRPAYKNVKLQWPLEDLKPPEPHFVVRDPDLLDVEIDAMIALFKEAPPEDGATEGQAAPQHVRLMSDMELTIGMLDPLSEPASRA